MTPLWCQDILGTVTDGKETAMVKTVVIKGTLDAKGEEIRYIKKLIEERELKSIVIDTSLPGEPLFLPDISREQVAQAAGTKSSERNNRLRLICRVNTTALTEFQYGLKFSCLTDFGNGTVSSRR